MPNPISVWRYDTAPAELKLSTNGGDEDWLAEIPPEFVGEYVRWMESPSFGGFDIEEHPHPTKAGWLIRIGSHA